MKSILVRTTILLTIAIVSITILGFSTNAVAGSHSREGKNHSHEESSTAADGAIEGLELNDGRKWDMDTHTRASFLGMAQSFSSADRKSLAGDGLKKLGTDLRNGVDKLIEGCTMEGAAHDQLHTYLMGYIPAVEKLSKSGEIDDANIVGHYLNNYNKYFK